MMIDDQWERFTQMMAIASVGIQAISNDIQRTVRYSYCNYTYCEGPPYLAPGKAPSYSSSEAQAFEKSRRVQVKRVDWRVGSSGTVEELCDHSEWLMFGRTQGRTA